MIAMRGVAHGARVPAGAASRKGLTGETGILEAAQLASSHPNIGVLITGDPGRAGLAVLGRDQPDLWDGRAESRPPAT